MIVSGEKEEANLIEKLLPVARGNGLEEETASNERQRW